MSILRPSTIFSCCLALFIVLLLIALDTVQTISPAAANDDLPLFFDYVNGYGKDNPSASVLQGSYLYVAADQGINVLDVSDPDNPIHMARVPVSQDVWRMEAAANRLYAIADTDADGPDPVLYIIDISTPARPCLLSSLERPAESWAWLADMESVGSLLYLNETVPDNTTFELERLVMILDMSNPSSPQQVSSLTLPDGGGSLPAEIEVVDDVAYFAGGAGGLFIYDVSNPAVPVSLNHFPCSTELQETGYSSCYEYLDVVDNRLYTAIAVRAEL